MSDQYGTYNLILRSMGVMARWVVDAPPGSGYWLDQDSLEEIEDAGLASRLGSLIVNKSGQQVLPLPGSIYSLARLGSLGGNAYRYASCNGLLFRRPSLTPGAYSQIFSGMSGNPWTWIVTSSTNYSALPYILIADSAGVLKDNGLLAAPQQAGIFQPQYPVQAQAQAPDQIDLDDYLGSSGGYTYSGISGGTIITYVNTTLTSAVTTVGIQSVSVAAPQQVGLFQLLTVDTGANSEVVLVTLVTPTGFQATFAKTHASGASVSNKALSVTVPASTTASFSAAFGGLPIAGWPTTLAQADYIGLYVFVSNPAQVQKITLSFDCGDGTFQSNYFYKVIGQGPLQTLLDANTDSSTGAADAVLSETLGIFNAGSGGISELNTGLNQWTPVLIQLSDFSGAGRADFNDPVFNWSNVNGYQVQIITNDNSSVTVSTSSLLLFGGAGPDSFAGVAYDYMFTFFNAVDGTESNPSMEMTNVNPPLQTNWVYPRRQPVKLTLTYPKLDSQTTHLRVYQRGGTLGDNFRRIDQIPVTGSPQQYTAIWSDAQIEAADTISFTNDVPVTSTLPNPVNTILSAAIATTNQLVTVTPAAMQSISVAQQVNLGNVVADNFETVIVISVGATSFTAFVQNTHAVGESVVAYASYGQPVSLVAYAFDQAWYAGDENNPNNLYYSAKYQAQAVSSANFVPISVPDEAITCIVATKANLFVSTNKRWYSISPGSNAGQSPTVYPTSADKGCLGPYAFVIKGESVYYVANDGIRAFTGGSSQLVSDMIRFVWQGVGTTPLVEADQTRLGLTVLAWWNNMLLVSYYGAGSTRQRVILDLEANRWRNDSVDAQSMFLEQETNSLLYGDSNGIIHQDRIDQAYDETSQGGVLAEGAIPITLQTAYLDQGQPQLQKQYNNMTVDVNTNGQALAVSLLFDDGQTTLALGSVTTTERARVNLNINGGLGFAAYKCSLILQGSGTQRIFLYQAAIRALGLAETRRSYDSYWQDMGTPQGKVAKELYLDYSASANIICSVYYDGSSTPGFTFILPLYNGVRESFRQRLPAILFRICRLVMDSAGNDFQLWNSSVWAVKPVQQGSGWEKIPLLSAEKG